MIDDEVWARVSAVLTRPEIIAEELAKLDRSDPVAADLESVTRSLAEIRRKRGNLLAALAECDDKDGRTAIAEALARLTEQARAHVETRAELEGRRSTWSAARERIGDPRAWCEQVASKLDTLTYATKRDALVWLGVTVRVFKTGSPDRWLIEASIPLEDVSSVEYRKT
jgi:hypothetical protein